MYGITKSLSISYDRSADGRKDGGCTGILKKKIFFFGEDG
jgi:hypothetical protein